MVAHRKDRVLVVGGGITGLAIAHELAGRGYRPVVVERDRVASHASGAAAGILAARGVVRSDVPGRMFYTRSLSAYPRWVERLVRESLADAPLFEGDDWCLFPHGGQADRFRQRLERESDPALWEELDGPAPWSGAPDPDEFRVFRFSQERWLSPVRLMAALFGATLRAGAVVMEQCGPVEVQREGMGWRARTRQGDFTADIAVVAAGPWSGEVLAPLGWFANLVAVRGQLALMPALHPLPAMVHLCDKWYVVPRDGMSVVGATVEHGCWEEQTTPEGMADLQMALDGLFPGLDLARATRAWSGIRPRTRDRIPHVGWLERGLFLASGHYRSGISMAPRTASLVASYLDGDVIPEDARELSPLRARGGWTHR